MVKNKKANAYKNFFDGTLILLSIVFFGFLVMAQPYSLWGLDFADPLSVNYTVATTLHVNEDVEQNFSIMINTSTNMMGMPYNITQINVTLPTSFSYVNGSNSTGGNISAENDGTWTNTDIGIKFNTTSDSRAGNQLTWTNDSADNVVIPGGNVTFNNSIIYFNFTASTPGKYNISVQMFYNGTEPILTSNKTNISIRVNDTTKPDEINVTLTGRIASLTRSNLSGSQVFNVSVADNGNLTMGNTGLTEVTGVNISFFNGSDFNSSYEAINMSAFSYRGNYWNISIDTTKIKDGVYNITITANDTNGNVNITNMSNVIVDNTAPTASVSCTPSTVNVGNAVACTCTPSDATSGVNTTETSIVASPSTDNTGTITQTCTFADMAGNTASASTTYNVELAAGGGSSSGGSSSSSESFYTKTIPMVGKELEDLGDVSQQLKLKQRVKVKIADEIHYVGVKEITFTSATIEISSDPVQIKLDVGEDAKLDLKDDGFYDVYVKLNSITNGKADLLIKYLHEEIPVGEGEGSAVETTGEIVEDDEEEAEDSLLWLWVVLGVVLVVIVAWVLMSKKKKK